jgi:outer membrane receptor protein involved in Fe transport
MAASMTDAVRLRLRGEHGWGRSWGYRQTYYNYFGGQPDAMADLELDTPGAHTLPHHTRIDLGARYTVQWKNVTLEAQLDIINVLDRQNPFDWGARPADGDSITRTTRRLPGRRLSGALTLRY